MMTTETVQTGSLMRVGLGVLVLLSGLCTVFVLLVTVGEAWQEHGQAQWPQVTARVGECGLTRTSSGPRQMFYIRCRLDYVADDRKHTATIYSRNVPSREIWQYPPNQIAPYEEWVNDHPEGTPIVVRYNPADYTKVALAEANMPGGGPRTPSNVKLLEYLAGSFLMLLAIARITRPGSRGQSEDRS